MKYCKKCGVEKPESEFRVYAVKGVGYVRNECSGCERQGAKQYRTVHADRLAAAARKWSKNNPEKRNAIKRAWYAKNKEKHKNTVLRRIYGISLEDYNAMLTFQEGKCGICRTETTGNCGRRLSVDHDHATGKVRGLLCGRCNSMLGFIKEHPGTLERAAEWIKK